MVGNLIAIAALALVVYAITLKGEGFDRVLIKESEKPQRLVGLGVVVFDPKSKGRAGWLSPVGRVKAHDGNYYDIQFAGKWDSPWGELTGLKAKTAMDGNPLSNLAWKRAGSTPIQALLPDGRLIDAELGVDVN